MTLVQDYVNKKVEIVTVLGQVYIGYFVGYDKPMNVVLKNCVERVFSKEGVTIIQQGLFIIRGDEIVLIGKLNEEKDDNYDWQCVVANPLPQASL